MPSRRLSEFLGEKSTLKSDRTKIPDDTTIDIQYNCVDLSYENDVFRLPAAGNEWSPL
jgi:hypothetical protein